MRVAQVPRGDAATEHRAVVALGVHDDACVLLGSKLPIRGDPAVAGEEFSCPLAQLDQLSHHLVLARLRPAERSRIAVGLPVVLAAEMLEAREALARSPRRLRIGLVKVTEHRLDRAVQAVEVKAVEAGRLWRSLVTLAQPLDELEHDSVTPHPGREAAKADK